jgi:hypothetical protein
LQTITTIGLDIAKSVFQILGVDADGKVVLRRQLKHLCSASALLRDHRNFILPRRSLDTPPGMVIFQVALSAVV